MFSFLKPKNYYEKTLKFLCDNSNKKSSYLGVIITHKQIRMTLDNLIFDSFGHMSYRYADGAIMFKDSEELDESNYYCIVLLDGRIFVNTSIINENSKIIIKDEFDDPINYQFDKDLYWESLIQVSKISFEII